MASGGAVMASGGAEMASGGAEMAVCRDTGGTTRELLNAKAQLREAKDYTSPIIKEDDTDGGELLPTAALAIRSPTRHGFAVTPSPT